MFRIISLVIMLFPATHLFSSVTLQEAIKQNLVSTEIYSVDESTHYLAPLELTLTNSSNKQITVSVPNGQIFTADKEEFQNFVVTEEQLLALGPKTSKTVEIKAMCIESGDRAPTDNLSYSVGNMARGNMLKLSEFIEEKKKFEPDGQFLMWDIADGYYNNETIDDFKLSSEGEIMAYFLTEEHEYLPIEIATEPITEPQHQIEYYGEFTMNLASAKKIHVALFNINGLLVEELYNNPSTPTGKTTIPYSFNSVEYTDDQYVVKLVMNDKVMLERTLEMN